MLPPPLRPPLKLPPPPPVNPPLEDVLLRLVLMVPELLLYDELLRLPVKFPLPEVVRTVVALRPTVALLRTEVLRTLVLAVRLPVNPPWVRP